MAVNGKANGKSPTKPTFVIMSSKRFRSDEVQALSGNAFKLLFGIMDQHNGRNNGSLRFGYQQAQELLHCSAKTAQRCFRELEAAGLIEKTKRGSFTNKVDARNGLSSAWRVTCFDFHKPTEAGPSNSFDGFPRDQ